MSETLEDIKTRLFSIQSLLIDAIAAKLQNPEELTAADLKEIKDFLRQHNIDAYGLTEEEQGRVKTFKLQLPDMPDFEEKVG